MGLKFSWKAIGKFAKTYLLPAVLERIWDKFGKKPEGK